MWVFAMNFTPAIPYLTDDAITWRQNEAYGATSRTIVYSTVYSGAGQSKHQALRHWPL